MTIALFEEQLPATVEDAAEKSQAISRALRRAARKASQPVGIIAGGGAGFRARKGDRAFRIGLIASFVLVVVCPLVVASVYWGLIASRQYATETKFAVRAGGSSPLDALGGLLGMSASQQAQDTKIVADYVKSRAAIEALDATLNLRQMYARSDVDHFSRTKADEPIEEFEKYWRKRADSSIDAMSGIITVNIRAFTPEDSVAISKKIVEFAERLVNDLSTRSRRDALAQARTELTRAETRLQAATAGMREARDSQGVLDATAAAEALGKIVTQLRLELVHSEQDLALQGPDGRNSPQSVVIQAKLASIRSQIDDYSRQIASVEKQDGPSSMADRLGFLSRKQVDLDLARAQYAQAAAIFENARVDLETQHAYLVSFLQPTLAQKSTYPRRWWEWSLIVFPSLLVWGVLTALAFLVRDNMAK